MASLRQEARVVKRFRIIEVAEAESVTGTAQRFGRSRTTVYKLISRHRESGLGALAAILEQAGLPEAMLTDREKWSQGDSNPRFVRARDASSRLTMAPRGECSRIRPETFSSITEMLPESPSAVKAAARAGQPGSLP